MPLFVKTMRRAPPRRRYALAMVAMVAVYMQGVAPEVSKSATTGKQAFFSPLRPVLPSLLPAFAFSRDRQPMRIPLVINVFLVNLDYNSNNVYMALGVSDLEEYLAQTIPSLQPSCLETGEQLHVQYDLWYHVAHIDTEHQHQIERAVRASMLPANEDMTEHARTHTGSPTPSAKRDGGSVLGSSVHFKVPIRGRVMDTLQKVHDMYAVASARRYRFDSASGADKTPTQSQAFFKRGGASNAASTEPSVQISSLCVCNLDQACKYTPMRMLHAWCFIHNARYAHRCRHTACSSAIWTRRAWPRDLLSMPQRLRAKRRRARRRGARPSHRPSRMRITTTPRAQTSMLAPMHSSAADGSPLSTCHLDHRNMAVSRFVFACGVIDLSLMPVMMAYVYMCCICKCIVMAAHVFLTVA